MKLRYKIIFALLAIAAVTAYSVYSYVNSALQRDLNNYPVKYTHQVQKYSDEYGLPCAVIYATIFCESRFDPNALSPAGAQGLMQITPETFEWLCSKSGEDASALDVFDPDVNIRYGTMFLSMLYKEFGDPRLAHAAYNAGRARIHDWMEDERYYKDGQLYNIPFEETRNYVEKIKRTIEKYSNILEVYENE